MGKGFPKVMNELGFFDCRQAGDQGEKGISNTGKTHLVTLYGRDELAQGD